MTEKTYRAFVTEGEKQGRVVERHIEELPEDGVLVKVHYSSVNYKDAMTLDKDANIAEHYPIVPGIDSAGVIEDAGDSSFEAGQNVIVTSYALGTGRDGGFAEYIRVPEEWIVPLPEKLSLKDAMILGTAGFTAALSIDRLEHSGITPEDKPVLVTGASGGVGSIAVDMLSGRGYSVTASTGRMEEKAFLEKLGADEVVSREEVTPEKVKPLQSQRWAAAVDPTGGTPLASILASLKHNGACAVSGLTAGVEVPTTVIPFILRGVTLLGVDSVYCPMEQRKHVWERAADDLKPSHMEDIAQEITLDGLQETLEAIRESRVRGRVIVRL
ncbi:oxidoreductase [Alkalicoccus urumqiensis]|uniref:Oxidoreductase n=1 Tax=Alkalicoccus urumqiensis TaxID=1548213 RepID=A0A2P6MGP7_ALKUR|nr:oxidoreductase [Alkalicoccus urumqiensis]PRO65459.1 oxidoreductase [Alkalicoccus urumqiensis]